ncbi:MAG: TonB-dependent receptor domain-containing protein [bacterium]
MLGYLTFNRRSSYTRHYLLLSLLIGYSSFLLPKAFGRSSHTGNLSGTVLDANTGSPLPGVNIILKGTVLGTSTNLDGEFNLSGISSGTYSVMASMIGYKIKTFNNVKIFPDNTTILDFRLVETMIEVSPVIVTASKKTKSLAETPNSVSVISALDIRKRNSFDIRDALKYAPGVSFIGGQVNIRGTTGYNRGAGSRVLLLTDGVPTMPGDSGSIKWDTIPFTVVEKVEVVKGAASALYGSAAIGGVVNVLTKEPSQKPKLSVRISGGLYEDPIYPEWKWTDQTLISNQQDVYFSNSHGNFGYIFSAGRRKSRGYKENSQFLRWNVFGKTDYKFDPATHLTFTGSFASEDHGDSFTWLHNLGQTAQPHRVSEQQAGNTILSTKLYLNSTFNKLATQNFAYKIRASYYRNHFANDFVDNNDRSTAQRFRGEYQADLEPSIRHSVTFGLEGTYDLVDGNIFGRRKAYIIGTYAQDEYKFTDRLSATAGFRFDFSKVITGQTEYQVSPRLGLIYNLSDVTTVRGSIGRGFRAPSVAELFTQTSSSGFRVIPNPNLDAESSWSAEVGLNTAIKKHILLNMAVYQERYFDFINPGLDVQGGNPIIQFKNVQDARIRGIETNVTTSWFSNRLNTVFSYVFVDPKDLETRKLLTYRPQHILTVSVTVKPSIFEFGADFRFASRLKDEQLELDPTEPRVPQKVLDARAGLTVGPYTLMFNVENVLYYNYTQLESNLEPTRQYSLTWQGDF